MRPSGAAAAATHAVVDNRGLVVLGAVKLHLDLQGGRGWRGGQVRQALGWVRARAVNQRTAAPRQARRHVAARRPHAMCHACAAHGTLRRAAGCPARVAQVWPCTCGPTHGVAQVEDAQVAGGAKLQVGAELALQVLGHACGGGTGGSRGASCGARWRGEAAARGRLLLPCAALRRCRGGAGGSGAGLALAAATPRVSTEQGEEGGW